MPLHRCTCCGQTFRSARDFGNHDCVKVLESTKTLEELLAMYEAQRAAKK